ncbi:MAG: NADH-quinone oxidoreductase subunit C [Gammaproteobacteria bacterium]|nr:NADH-quinone oxidoreductase subunit C [Gammaproteobacteria bacterium]
MLEREQFLQQLHNHFPSRILKSCVKKQETTLVLSKEHLISVSLELRDLPSFAFEMLIDLAGVDYLTYGHTEWETETSTATGFSRGVNGSENPKDLSQKFPARFAVVTHLLSLIHNRRLRLKVFLSDGESVPSLVPVWASANWFEREAFDLFGIGFEGHPDLRRILTDYGFLGHPLRKDFPLIGKVEARYDEGEARVVTRPVSITPRVTVPRVIRRNLETTDNTHD